MDSKAISKKEVRRCAMQEKILSIAWELFLDVGYSGVTMSKIAEMIGGSKATLWNHFTSKEMLFKRMITKKIKSFHEEIFNQLTFTVAIEDTLDRFCRNFIARIVSDQGIALRRFITAETARFPELPQMFYREAISPLVSILASYIQKATREGLLAAPDPHEAAETLISSCHGRCFRWKEFGITVPTDQEINDDAALAARIFLSMYSRHHGH